MTGAVADAECCRRMFAFLLDRFEEIELRRIVALYHPRGRILGGFLPGSGASRAEVAGRLVRMFVVTDRLADLWDGLRTERPSLGPEIGRLEHVCNDCEGPTGGGDPRPSAVDSLLEALSEQWTGADGIQALAAVLECADVLQLGAGTAAGSRVHLLLLELCARGDLRALQALARSMNLDEGGRSASATVQGIAEAIEHRRWPSGLDRWWLSVTRPTPDHWHIARSPAGAEAGAPPIRGQRSFEGPLEIPLERVGLTIELRPTETGLSLRISGSRTNGIVGAAAKLWTRVRGVRRRLFPGASDHLGSGPDTCLADFSVAGDDV